MPSAEGPIGVVDQRALPVDFNIQNFKIVYESPTATFDVLLDEDQAPALLGQVEGSFEQQEPCPEERDRDTKAHNAAESAKVQREPSLLATCSFYDNALHIWKWEANQMLPSA